MALTPVTTETIIARNFAGLFGKVLGFQNMRIEVAKAASDTDAYLNTLYVNTFGGTQNGSVPNQNATLPSEIADLLVTNTGITNPQTVADAKAYVVWVLTTDIGYNGGIQHLGSAIDGILYELSLLENSDNAEYGAIAAAWNASVAAAEAYSGVINNADTTLDNISLPAFFLNTGSDNLVGSAGDDVFTARIIDNQNSLQSGDKIDGGAGNDTLTADVGNSQNFAITAETNSVENVLIRAQAVSRDSTDNNTSITNEVQIDAQRMVGVNHWESNNSRADLLIEDVRILPNQITKDITIAMVETDPGHVDYGVYFDQYSLRNSTSTSSTLSLELLDTRSAAAGTAPLLDNPYWGFSFTLDGVQQIVSSPAIDEAQTYAQLLTAITDAVAANANLAGRINVALGNDFTRFDTLTGQAVTGERIVLSTIGSGVITAEGARWQTQDGTVPASSGLHTNIGTVSISATDKVTSKIILDDVGRGSTGGDLVVGGLSVGDTSTSRGVERFEIEVRDNSKLQTINSTNNTLQEVTVVNGVTSSSSFAYSTTVANQGNLSVLGEVLAGNNTSGGSLIDAALPGTETANGGDQHNGFGFSDVRLIDASDFLGNFAFNAEITERSIAKYVNLVDTQPNPAPDTVNAFGAVADFQYMGGAGNDSINVQINPDVAGSRSLLVVGREDFTFKVDGGAGNDNITVRLTNGEPGQAQNWYNNQDLNNNITINGGDGNDTIWTPGAGDTVINGGAGNDTIYTDNTGVQTVAGVGDVTGHWVFNTNNAVGADLVAARNITDLRSDVNDSYNFFKGTVTVSFKGVPSAQVLISNSNYRTSDLQINQAIKNAINTDPVLSKLLLAEDGPANSLVVKSLIDGDMNTADLTVAITLPPEITLTPSEISGAGAVYLPAGTVATAANVRAAMDVAKGIYDGNADYVTQMATNGVVNIIGDDSFTTSDNLIQPGTGNDVIVLGTTEGATFANASNEVVKFDADFGNDVIVNFDNTGAGIDLIDFSSLKGINFGAALTTNNSINVVNAATLATSPTVTQKAAIEALFNAAAANNVAGAGVIALDHVFVAVSANNVGSVYTVADAVGVNNAVATLQGTIDLADTSWLGLTAANFTSTAAATLASYGAGAGVPAIVPTYEIIAEAGSVNEGDIINFTVTTTNVADGTELTYNLSGIGVNAINADDIVGGLLTGTTVVTNGVANIAVELVTDLTTEGPETLTVTVADKSASVDVNDTSIEGGTIIPVGVTGVVIATPASDNFIFDAVAARAEVANTQATIQGFGLVAGNTDTLTFNLPTAAAATTLQAFIDAPIQGVSATLIEIGSSAGILVDFGPDGDASGPVSILLAGVLTPADVIVNII